MAEKKAKAKTGAKELSIDELRRVDQVLLQDLWHKEQERVGLRPPATVGPWTFRNGEIALHAKDVSKDGLYNTAELQQIEEMLGEKGGLAVGINRRHKLDPDDPQPIAVVVATDSVTGSEMCDHVWIRDQAQVARAKMHMWLADRGKYATEGDLAREIMESGMELMSTPAQLERFQEIIAHKGDREYIDDPHNWPHMFLGLDNLNSAKTEGWPHRQDAWQMQALLFFEAVENGLVSAGEIERHKNWQQFLGMIPAFLEAVDFTQSKNYGSWEEIPAVRTSVIGIETVLLGKIAQFSDRPEFAFLGQYADKEIAERLHKEGVAYLQKNPLDHETNGLDPADPRARTSDAALLYLLDYDVPQLLYEDGSGFDARDAFEWGAFLRILAVVKKLKSPGQPGMRRYGQNENLAGDPRDSYQGPNFYTNEEQAARERMYSAEAANETAYFTGRDGIVAEGESALWMHPVAQLGCWAAKKFIDLSKRNIISKDLLRLAQESLTEVMAGYTGEGEYTAKPDESMKPRIIRPVTVEEFRLPEAYIQWRCPDAAGEMRDFRGPSPNTPLNWGVAKTAELLALLQQATKIYESF